MRLSRAVLIAAQQDFSATNGKAFHILEGIVEVQDDGKYVFTPNKAFKQLLETKHYPAVLKIEEMKLLNWIIAVLEGDNG